MLGYIIRRLFYMCVLLVLVSIVGFTIIQLPPGDYVSTLISNLETGSQVDQAEIAALKQRYGLDKPIYIQYFLWVSNFIKGDFGRSFLLDQPVNTVIGERLVLTMIISILTILFTYPVAIMAGIYSATNQYSIGDYVLTFLSFIGLAIPNFLLALVLMFISYKYFNANIGGLFSLKYATAPWSWAKFLDMLQHVWIAIIVVGTAGTASLFRIMRGTLLDELRKPYVVAARSRGVSEIKLLFRYPVRIAINPIISRLGWILPTIISGSAIASLVLSLPTTGPLLIQALLAQDMYLGGSFIMFLSILTVIGTFLSDILLALADPRIRYDNS